MAWRASNSEGLARSALVAGISIAAAAANRLRNRVVRDQHNTGKRGADKKALTPAVICNDLGAVRGENGSPLRAARH
ncbi:hypothetical protein EB815_16500 [Mesorhizobium loti]|nr:hypothetical protein EB815_16500 [Mesorhizobium loti]QKC89519.1 hypothetical protein EB230_14705 [Mesorhizobium sp. NZP2234]